MGIKYYSKVSPRTKFYTSAGTWLQFDVIDHEVGVAVIADEQIQRDIVEATRRNRGGIIEITKDQYLELQGKKKADLKPRWREELSKAKAGSLTQAARLPQNDPVAALAAAGRAERVTQVAEAARPSPVKRI